MANITHTSCSEPTSATRTASTTVLPKHLSECKAPLISVRKTEVVPTPPHLTDHYLWSILFPKYDLDLLPPRQPLYSFNPCPHLSPPLSQHPVCLESHTTFIYLLCQSDLSKICSDHSPDQHFAMLSIPTEESSQTVKLHNQIYLAPPPENLI